MFQNSHIFLPDCSPSHEPRPGLTASQANKLHWPELLSNPSKWPPHPQKENSWSKWRYIQNYFIKLDIRYPLKIRHQSSHYYSLPAFGNTDKESKYQFFVKSGRFPWFLYLRAHGFKTYLCLFFSKYNGL